MSEWVVETLSRNPIRVDDETNPEALKAELWERLEALLISRLLEPTAEGWRDLALALALEHEPAFQIETPVDRSSLGGRPIGFGDFFLRSIMKSEKSKLKKSEPRKDPSQSQIAKIVARRTGKAAGTINNLFAKDASIPDSVRREKYCRKAAKALKAAADSLSQE
jgi:hypothetical protein